MQYLGEGLNYTPHHGLRKSRLQLHKIALHPALQIVIFGLDFAPRTRRDGLVVAGKQNPRALTQHTCALRLWSWLEAHGNPKSTRIDDER